MALRRGLAVGVALIDLASGREGVLLAPGVLLLKGPGMEGVMRPEGVIRPEAEAPPDETDAWPREDATDGGRIPVVAADSLAIGINTPHFGGQEKYWMLVNRF